MVDLFAVQGNIKLFIKEHKTLYTSQKITVSVILMTDAFSISDARIDFPASPNYIVQEPKSAAFLNKEEIDGVDWQQVHYEYDVYALRAGKMEIPPMNISFAGSMGYGQEKKAFEFTSEVLSFQVEAPKGIKNNRFVLVTDKYTLESDHKPKKKTLIVGDAVELMVVQKAQGVPDILLTPIVYKNNSHLRVYDKEPLLKNALPGDMGVSRTDSFTFVATAEGNVTIPSQETIWWNSTTKKVHTEKIPAFSFEIISDPQIAIDAKKTAQKQLLIYVALIFLVLVIFYIIFAPKIRNYKEEHKRRYKQSEAGQFDQFINSQDTPALYLNFYIWLEMIHPSLARSGFRGLIDAQASFENSLLDLESVLASQEKEFDKITFINEAKKLRSTLLTEQKQPALPLTINP